MKGDDDGTEAIVRCSRPSLRVPSCFRSRLSARQIACPGHVFFSATSITQYDLSQLVPADSGEEQWQNVKYAETITTSPLRLFTRELVTHLTALSVQYISWRQRVSIVDAAS